MTKPSGHDAAMQTMLTMPKKLNIKKLLEANPSVDAEKLTAALKLIKELKKAGVVINPGYDLAIPFSKRVVGL